MRVLLPFVLVVAGCGDIDPDCRCLVRDPDLILTVQDATTDALIDAPTFTEDGQTITGACTDPTITPCPSWAFAGQASYTLTVSAPGHTSTTITATLQAPEPTDCCPIVIDTKETVMLAPGP